MVSFYMMISNISKACIADAAKILSLQYLSYQSEADLYPGIVIPPMVQTIEEISIEIKNWHFLQIEQEKNIIGSVRAYIENDTCYIGRLIVHPDFQCCGLGSVLLDAIENECSEAQRYELFTGQKSEKNLHFYKKRGYTAFKEQYVTGDLILVYLEKINTH